MILLEDVMPRLLPIGQESFISYSPSKKIYLSQTTGRDFFQAQRWFVSFDLGKKALIKI